MHWEKLEPCDICRIFNAANGEIQIIRSFMAMLAKCGIKCGIEDSTGRLLYLNGVALKDWNVANDCYQGQTILALRRLASGSECLRHNRKIVTNGRPAVFFVVDGTQQGQTEVYTMFKFPIWDSDDDIVIGLIILPGTSHHVTEVS